MSTLIPIGRVNGSALKSTTQTNLAMWDPNLPLSVRLSVLSFSWLLIAFRWVLLSVTHCNCHHLIILSPFVKLCRPVCVGFEGAHRTPLLKCFYCLGTVCAIGVLEIHFCTFRPVSPAFMLLLLASDSIYNTLSIALHDLLKFTLVCTFFVNSCHHLIECSWLTLFLWFISTFTLCQELSIFILGKQF